jgi:pSer/pThr/pTyr-binding forkhead associated (FHA) protein
MDPAMLIAQAPVSGTIVPLSRTLTVVGRSPDARLRLRSDAISRLHAIIVRHIGGIYLRDLSRAGNVQLNGRPVREIELRDADRLEIGPFVFNVRGIGVADLTDQTIPRGCLSGATGLKFIEGRTLLIGRAQPCDLRVEDTKVSRVHAMIFWLEGGYHIRDLHSRTGTWVNGVAVKREPLADGDLIEIGQVEFRYRDARRDPPALVEGGSLPLDRLTPPKNSGASALPGDAGDDVLFNRPFDLSLLVPIDERPSDSAAAMTAGAFNSAKEKSPVPHDGNPIPQEALSLPVVLMKTDKTDAVRSEKPGASVIGMQWGEYEGQILEKDDPSAAYELRNPVHQDLI